MLIIGCDHGGLNIKLAVIEYLKSKNIPFEDVGTHTTDSIDYAPIAAKVAHGVADGTYEKGLLFCGTGIGISIAANKVKGIRAAVCTDPLCAKLSRLHNNSNILAMGARITGRELAKEILKAWLDTEFEGDRHQARIDDIKKIEEGKKLY